MKQKKKRDLDFLIFPIIIFISFLLMWFYVEMRKYYCEGGLSLPLDDPFIFFQYARNMADGHFFKYNIEDKPTTGVTSLLWQILLCFGFILGFHEMKIIYWSLFLSLIILILSGISAYLIGKRLVSHHLGIIASLIVLLNGPFLWAVFSGMDTGLFGMLILLSFLSFLTRNFILFSLSSSLMVISRPEGFILYFPCLFILLFNQMLLPKNEKASIAQIPLFFIPMIVGGFWFFLNFIFTGSPSFNTMVAKSAITRSDFSFFDDLAASIRYFFFFLKEVFSGFAGDYIQVLNANSGYPAVYFPPFALFFFVLAVFVRSIQEIKTKRLGPYFLAFLWFFGGILITSIMRPSEHAHWHRYVIPYYPLFLVITVIGIYHLSQAFQTYKDEAFLGISIFFILFSILTTIYFGIAYGKNSKDIYLQQIEAGKWVSANIPKESIIALNDAGAIKYISQRYCIDLVGLCYPKIARSSTSVEGGNAPLYEFLEKLEKKPDYFIIYPSWFAFGNNILGSEIASFPLYEPTIAGAGSDPKKVYKADYKWLNTGDDIKLQSTKEAVKGKTLVDKIDIADIESEIKHSYKNFPAEPGLSKHTFVTYASYSEEPSIIVSDGGRITTGKEIFKIKTIPNKDLTIITRATSPFSIGVYIDNTPAAWWRNTKGSQETSLWYEPMITIPGNFIKNSETEVKLEVVDKHRASYFTTYYWFFQ